MLSVVCKCIEMQARDRLIIVCNYLVRRRNGCGCPGVHIQWCARRVNFELFELSKVLGPGSFNRGHKETSRCLVRRLALATQVVLHVSIKIISRKIKQIVLILQCTLQKCVQRSGRARRGRQLDGRIGTQSSMTIVAEFIQNVRCNSTTYPLIGSQTLSTWVPTQKRRLLGHGWASEWYGTQRGQKSLAIRDS
jgi:hypothetical protein